MRVVVFAVVAVLLAGCQVRVATDVTVRADGGGEATVTVLVDDELRDRIRDAGVDPWTGLEEAAAGASWTAGRVEVDDAAGVALSTRFDDPAELGDRVDALTAGLAPDDGALLGDVSLTRTDDDGYAFTAAAGIDPPRIVGTLPLVAGPGEDVVDGEDLGELLAASGDRFATAELRLRMPTVPTAPDATIRGTTATWRLPVDGLEVVTATAPAPPVGVRTALVVAVVFGLLLLAAFGLRAFRRRTEVAD